MSTDDENKPAVEQQPPDPFEIAKKRFWDILRRALGPRGAFIIFAVFILAWTFRNEIAEVVSDLHAQIVEWKPLPKAKPDVFTVAIARLEGDDEKGDMESTIAQDLRDLKKSNGITVLEFRRTITADSDEDVQAGRAKARKWLTQSGAQVLIWGKVLTAPSRPSVPQLYWTISESSNPKKPSGRYVLGEDLRLPPVFQTDLSDILRLLVVTESSAFNAEEGHFVADRLRPFIEHVRHLLEGDAAKNWTAEDIARTKVVLSDALYTVGEQSGNNGALSEAIGLYNGTLEGFTQQQYPLDWAMTQNNLGKALRSLGERESGTQHLTEAVAAYRAALQELTQARGPLDWAMTQNNLGSALWTLGERMHDTNALCQALRDHVSTWQVFSETAPHYASIAVAGAKTDVAAIHNQSRGTAPPCLQTYSADLTQMDVPN